MTTAQRRSWRSACPVARVVVGWPRVLPLESPWRIRVALQSFRLVHGIVNGSTLGLAYVVVTAVICLVLFPLYGWQARTTCRIQTEARLIAGQSGELRRKHRAEPQKLHEEMMKLYRGHGISPVSNLIGCLPTLVQTPILYGLGIMAAANDVPSSDREFLWLGDVSKSPRDLLARGVAAHEPKMDSLGKNTLIPMAEVLGEALPTIPPADRCVHVGPSRHARLRPRRDSAGDAQLPGCPFPRGGRFPRGTCSAPPTMSSRRQSGA